ncbi:hypothetical protein FRC12_010076 [Ceratobasidium sp. 428]|nr:hypothetical protein FRC12_010076 [Ceratobasidium sp. 428]
MGPSERIAEVNLGQEFDILDVLAVCHSIQTTKTCRTYTLQRYNCYFLCLTVLAMLTRRVASWETKIDAAQWDSRVDSMLMDLSNLRPEESRKHTILAICAYLEPENPRRARFIFDILQEHLKSRAEGFTVCQEAMRQVLWQADWEPVLQSTLAESITAISNAIQDSGYCSQQIRHAFSTSDEDKASGVLSSAVLAEHGFPIIAEELSKIFDRFENIYKELVRMWRIEHHIPSSKLVFSRLLGTLGAPLLALVPVSKLVSDSSTMAQLLVQVPSKRWLPKLCRLVLPALALDRLEGSDAMQKLMNKAIGGLEDGASGLATVHLLDKLALKGVLGQPEISLLIRCTLDQSCFAETVAGLAASGLKSILPMIMEEEQRQIQLTLVCRIGWLHPAYESYVLKGWQGQQESGQASMTIGSFQESYIKLRIVDHARRVDTHLLAAADFVIEDIEETMREVWQKLPSGFGVGAARSSLESVVNRSVSND